MPQQVVQETISFMQRVEEFGIFGYVWILIVSGWAGTARYLASLNGHKPTLLGWVTDTVISGFVGVMAASVCQYYRLDFLLTSAITGISAHNGARSLYIMGSLLKKGTIGFSMPDDKNKDEK